MSAPRQLLSVTDGMFAFGGNAGSGSTTVTVNNFTLQNAELLHAVGLRLANSCDWPNWSEDSEFRAARDRSAADRQGACTPAPAKPGERG